MVIDILLPHAGLRPIGGLAVAYRYADGLALCGHHVRLLWAPSVRSWPIRQLKRLEAFLGNWRGLGRWFAFQGPVERIAVSSLHESSVRKALMGKPRADVTIATAWQTAEYLNSYGSVAGAKFYLVQDLETWGGQAAQVERTWLYPFTKIVISNWLLLQGERLGATDLHYIPNGLDGTRFACCKQASTRGLVVGVSCHLAPFKGAREGVAVLEALKQRYPELRAILFGKEARPTFVPTWMEYHRDPSATALTELYNEMAVFLCTSWQEGWGLPGMEAMACGAALASSDNGGVREYAVDGETALLFPPRDHLAAVAAVDRLLSDTKVRYSFAEAGSMAVRQFRWENSVRSLEQLLLSQVSP